MRLYVCICIFLFAMLPVSGFAYAGMIPISSARLIETSGFTAYTPPGGTLLIQNWDEDEETAAFGAFAGTVSGEALTPAGCPVPVYAHGEAEQDSFFGSNFYQFRGRASGNYAGTGGDWASGTHAHTGGSFVFEITEQAAIDLYWAVDGQIEGEIGLSGRIALSRHDDSTALFETTDIAETGPQLFHTVLDPGVYLFETFAAIDSLPAGGGGSGMSGVSIASKVVASTPITPEPATSVLFLLGLSTLAAIRRRR